MPELRFMVESAEAPLYTAAPLLQFTLRIVNDGADLIHAVSLHSQLRINAPRRRYSPVEQERLQDLFGTADRWAQTLRGLLWTHADANVPAFTGETTALLPVPCTYDFEVAAAKYFAALDNGEIPLTFLFSGTIFYEANGGALQVQQISWESEARFDLPVRTWQAAMDAHFPGTAWLRLRRDVFDRLYQYRLDQGVATWEAAIERLLPAPTEQQTAADAAVAR